MKIFHVSEFGRPALMFEFENEQRAKEALEIAQRVCHRERRYGSAGELLFRSELARRAVAVRRVEITKIYNEEKENE